METRETLVERCLPAITSIATGLTRRFPTTDGDDLRQEMVLWLLLHKRRVSKFLDEDTYPRKVGDRMLAKSLRNHALAVCHHDKAMAVGYDVDDLFFYGRALVRELLDLAWDEDYWRDVSASEDAVTRTKSDPATGGNRIALMADLRRGLDRLSDQDEWVLAQVHRDRVPWDELAIDAGASEEAVKKRYQRALERLSESLGGERPDFAGVGSRHVLANGAAQAITHYQEAGE